MGREDWEIGSKILELEDTILDINSIITDLPS